MEPNQEPNLNNTYNQPPRRGSKAAVMSAVVIFVLIILAMFGFAYYKQQKTETADDTNDNTTTTTDERYGNIQRIDGKHFYNNGTHTIVGAVNLPTPCDLLEVDARVAESSPEQVTLDFTVKNDAEFCAEQVTEARFMVTAKASEDAKFSAIFENRAVELNLVEAAPGESPEDFELFIKG